MKDLRKFERFPLRLQTRAETFISGKKEIFDLKTSDISASGAFIYTPQTFPLGTHFKLNLTVSNNRIKELTGAGSLIDCEGKVVRSTPSGMGIHFDKQCRIWSLKGL